MTIHDVEAALASGHEFMKVTQNGCARLASGLGDRLYTIYIESIEIEASDDVQVIGYASQRCDVVATGKFPKIVFKHAVRRKNDRCSDRQMRVKYRQSVAIM